MEKRLITAAEVEVFLQKLIGLPVSGFTRGENGATSLEIGKRFQLSQLVADDESWRKKEFTVPEYAVTVKSEKQLRCFSKGEFAETELDSWCQAEQGTAIQGQVVKAATLLEENVLRIELDSCTIRISARAENGETWCVLQPETEEDQLVGNNARLTKRVRQRKRWSPDFAAERDKWHPFPLTEQDACPEEASESFLPALVGARISYALKSADMNFYDIGFCVQGQNESAQKGKKEYALHITCGFTVVSAGNPPVVFWGNSEKDAFEEYAALLVHQKIEQVLLLEENVLRICTGGSWIEVVPADDSAESWRLLPPEEDAPHLIAADSWRSF